MPNLGALLGRGSRLTYILIGAIALFVFLTIVLILRSFGSQTGSNKIVLQFWGVFDPSSAFDRAIRTFEGQHPNIQITYTEYPFQNYESNAVNALAAGNGPDIWLIHNTWLPKQKDKLQPVPAKGLDGNPIMTVKDFNDQFVDVAANDLISDGKIYGMPLYADTLALYYNKDLFNSAGITGPPANWNEFNDDVQKLTQLDSSNNIIHAGAAIGSVANINRPTDILMSLMIQSGVQMTDDAHTQATFAKSVNNQKVGEIALQYYTDFTNPLKETYTWNASQHYSIDAFTEGNVAMMFNYSHQIPLIRQKAPHLNFAVAPMPQVNPSDARTFANYWAPAVTLGSKHPVEAWEFVKFLTSREGITDYLNATNRPSARRDLIDLQKNDPDLGVFAEQALSARSWYQIDNTAIETIFANMIDDVNLGRASVHDALQSAQTQVNVLMQKQ